MKPLLKLHWTAIFKDGSTVSQYDEYGVEHLYKEVQDKFDQLEKFYLVHTHLPFKATVDLSQGLIFINSEQSTFNPASSQIKNNIRLIYTRRNTVKLVGNIVTNHVVVYLLGFQYNDDAGQNHKVVIQIDQDTNITVGTL